jgi:hypothetical protein
VIQEGSLDLIRLVGWRTALPARRLAQAERAVINLGVLARLLYTPDGYVSQEDPADKDLERS